MKFLDLAVKAHTFKERAEIGRFLDSIGTSQWPEIRGKTANQIWWWANKRWPREFSQRDCELRDGFTREYYSMDQKTQGDER